MRASLLAFVAVITLCLCSASCHHDDDGSTGSTGGPGAPASFALTDLAGDWNGILMSDNPLVDAVNFYLRHDATGTPWDARDGRGHRYNNTNAKIEVFVTDDGQVQVLLEQLSGQTYALQLTGQIDEARGFHSGSFVLFNNLGPELQGTYTAYLSSGAGHFSQDLLAGQWLGSLFRDTKTEILSLQLDGMGTVLGGGFADVEFKSGGPNTGAMQFADDAIGLILDVRIRNTNGSLTTLPYVIVDDTGTYMSGPLKFLYSKTSLFRLEKQDP